MNNRQNLDPACINKPINLERIIWTPDDWYVLDSNWRLKSISNLHKTNDLKRRKKK